jgi:hypothetical protein
MAFGILVFPLTAPPPHGGAFLSACWASAQLVVAPNKPRREATLPEAARISVHNLSQSAHRKC